MLVPLETLFEMRIGKDGFSLDEGKKLYDKWEAMEKRDARREINGAFGSVKKM